eukprot:TRINITY_DN5136_c0_g1_i3.p1 TRINITY_DN5136_c0_g1~~TRINITY_DN5136_c0_g1_i3.p1  ORF type:complete len:110 (-),score=17.53 TRINITY_DN5136_c0_g1_i3:15-344(-)
MYRNMLATLIALLTVSQVLGDLLHREENFDLNCFEENFPVKSNNGKLESPSVELRIVHRQDYVGSLGEDHYIRSNQTYILDEGSEIVLTFKYHPLWGFLTSTQKSDCVL